MLKVGINPYGLTYTLGIQGQGTPRANPAGRGLSGFIDIASQIGARSIELHEPWLSGLGDGELASLRTRLEALQLTPIVGSGLPHAPIGNALRPAVALGAGTVRLALSRLLCGDRATLGDGWARLVDDVRENLIQYAGLARQAGIVLAIENHQDFDSGELLELCAEAGPNVGICFDLANTFPVAEAPLEFARRIAPMVRHVHLKDYNVQFTAEGIRLVRCAIGDGAVPIVEIVAILAEHHDTLTASIELAALEARHVRLFRPDWWNFYSPRTARQLATCLGAARHRCLSDDADYRTPWECGNDAELERFELDQLQRSVANLTALGIMKGRDE